MVAASSVSGWGQRGRVPPLTGFERDGQVEIPGNEKGKEKGSKRKERKGKEGKKR